MPLARRLAGRYNRRPDSLDDLTQVAALALVKAVDRFDPTRGIAFSSLRRPDDRRRDQAPLPRPRLGGAPAARAGRARAARRGRRARVHRRAPTARRPWPSCAERTDAHRGGGPRRAARRPGRERELARRPVSKQDEGPASLGDRIGSDDDGYGLAEQRVLLEGLLRGVSPRDREILHMRYFEDMTQAEIGAAFGVSQMQVSRLCAARSSACRSSRAGRTTERDGDDDRARVGRRARPARRRTRDAAEIARWRAATEHAPRAPRGTGTPLATARRSAGRRRAIDAALRVAAPRPHERLVDLGDRQRAAAAAPRRARHAPPARGRRRRPLAAACSPRVGELPAGLVAADRPTPARVPLPDGWADVVTCAYLLHLLDRAGARRGARRGAAAAGAAAVVAPRRRDGLGRPGRSCAARCALLARAMPGGLRRPAAARSERRPRRAPGSR